MQLIFRIIAAALIVCLFATAVLGQDEQAREEEFLIRGLIRDGLYEVAADRIFAFLRDYPEHSRRRSMAEDIVGKLLDKDSAIAAVPLMRAYRELFPGGNRFRFMTYHLAATLFDDGEYDEAAPLLSEIIASTGYKSSRTQEARNKLAHIYLERGESNAVIALTEEVPERKRPPALLLIYAEALLAGESDVLAEEVLVSLKTRRRLDTEIKTRSIRLLGDMYIRQYRWDDAAATLGDFSFTEDTEWSENERAIALALGSSFYHLDRFEEAWGAVKPLWQAKPPATSDAHVPVVFMALNEFDAAANMLKSSFDGAGTERGKLEAGELLVAALLKSGDRAAAAETLQTMAKETQSPVRRVQFLLRAVLLVDDLSERISLLKEAAALNTPDPLQAEVYYHLGDALASKGDIEEAAQAWSETVDLKAHSLFVDLALLRLAQNEVAGGKLDDAAARIEVLLQRKPALDIQEEAHGFAFRIAVQNGNWEKAQQHFQQLQLSVPGFKISPITWRDRVRLALVTDKPDDATAAFENLYQIDGNEFDIPELHPLLAAARGFIQAGESERGIALLDELERGDQGELSAAARFVLARADYLNGQAQKAYDRALAQSLGRTDWIAESAALLAADAAGNNGDVGEQVRILQEMISGATSEAAKEEAVSRLQKIAINSGNYNGALQVDPRLSDLEPDALYAIERRVGEAARRYTSGDYEGARAIYEQLPDGAYPDSLHRIYFASALFRTGVVDRAAGLVSQINIDTLPLRMRWEFERIRVAGFIEQNKQDEALTVIEQLLGQPLPEAMRYELQLDGAAVAKAGGNWARADELYQRYLSGSRGRSADGSVLERIAQSYIEHEDYSTAIELLRRMQLRAEDAESSVQLGFRIAELIALKDGADAAAEAFLNIAYRNPGLGQWPAKARLRAAEQFEKAGHTEFAQRQYRLVAERFAGTKAAEMAASRLRALARKQNRIEEEQLRPPGN